MDKPIEGVQPAASTSNITFKHSAREMKSYPLTEHEFLNLTRWSKIGGQGRTAFNVALGILGGLLEQLIFSRPTHDVIAIGILYVGIPICIIIAAICWKDCKKLEEAAITTEQIIMNETKHT